MANKGYQLKENYTSGRGREKGDGSHWAVGRRLKICDVCSGPPSVTDCTTR